MTRQRRKKGQLKQLKRAFSSVRNKKFTALTNHKNDWILHNFGCL